MQGILINNKCGWLDYKDEVWVKFMGSSLQGVAFPKNYTQPHFYPLNK